MSEKKPSPVANLILLVLLLAVVGAVGGGGFWAYKKFFKGQGKEVVGADKPVPVPGEVTGEPVPGEVTGEPVPGEVTGEPVPGEVTGEPVPAEVTGEPVPGEVTGEPIPGEVTGEPVPGEPIDTDPAPVDPLVADPAIPESVPAEPVTEDLPKREETPGLLAFSPESPEGKALLADALQRVDEAPGKTAQERALAKKGLRQAKQLGKIATVYFNTSGARLSAGESARLDKALQQASVKSMTENAKAVCFVLGFADKTGPDDLNKRLSMTRAQNVIAALEAKGLKLGTTPVAIGPSELIDKENQGKNRAAEVWIVVP